MKQLLLTTVLAILLLPSITSSQQLEHILVNAAETPNEEVNGILLTWTLGELMVEYYANGPVLDQGFLQCANVIVSTHEIEDLGWNLSLWPNPTGVEQINVQSTANLEITLFNSLGQALKRTRCNNETIPLNLTSWPAGSYWLHARAQDGRSRVLQFQKR